MAANDLNNIILIVDDDPIQRLLFSKSLKDEHYTIIEAKNGLDAVESFERHSPGLVILDIEMPVMNGFEACQKIRDLPYGKYAAIIITTGLDDDDSIEEAYNAGATDFISKPINWTIISHRIKYVLRSNRLMMALNASQRKNYALLKALPDTILSVDSKGVCTDSYIGNSRQSIFPPVILNKNVREYLSPESNRIFQETLKQVILSGKPKTFEFTCDINGSKYYQETRMVKQSDDTVLAIVRDITEKKENEERVWRMAYFDSLTGLPNRQLFKDRLGQMLEYASRYDKNIAVVYIDLDRFNQINNTFGQQVGDKLLKAVVSRFEKCFRKSDCVARDVINDETNQLARLGGDEFVILLSDLDISNNYSHVETVAKRVIEILSDPITLNHLEVYVTPSLGIAVYPADGDSGEELIKNAHAALKMSKQMGGNTFHIYNKEMNNDKYDILALQNDLRRAVDKNNFELYYQPQVDIQNDKLIGAEALIRWIHPEHGFIPPDYFIPIAEDIGLINEIGHWVLNTAVRQLSVWRNNGISVDSIGVNLSAHQFCNNNLVEQVDAILGESDIEPCMLDLEITESTVMQDAEKTINILNELKKLGIKLSIDDFGTGYSSLSYLQKFPLDKLKIDRAFINKIDENDLDEKIINVILALAKVLNISVVAEGAENDEHIRILRNLGCDIVQGYYYSKPLPAAEFEQFYQEFYNKNQDAKSA